MCFLAENYLLRTRKSLPGDINLSNVMRFLPSTRQSLEKSSSFPISETAFFWIRAEPTAELCFFLFSLADFISSRVYTQTAAQKLKWDQTQHAWRRKENTIEFKFAPKHMLQRRQIPLLCISFNPDCLITFYLWKTGAKNGVYS